MKALRKLHGGPGNLEIVEVPSPLPGEGEVLVEVRRAAVCGTDIHILHGLYPRVRPPVTAGHEFCGVISGLGAKVQGWRLGDRVTVDSTDSFCGVCSFCQSGQTQLCNQRTGYGSSRDGGFTSLVCVRQGALHRLPDPVSFQEGALCEPLACAAHAVMEISSVRRAETALITGPGAIGLLVLQVAKAMGARVIITGTRKDEQRLQLALRLGADHIFRIEEQDLHSFLAGLTGGKGVDLAYECSGFEGGAKDCLAAVKKGGELIQVGLFGHPISVNYDEVVLKEVKIKGSFAHAHGSWEKAIQLLEERKVYLKPLVTGEFPLDQWNDAFRFFEEGKGLKYLLYPVE